MIPNHPQFLAAVKEKKKVSLRFYSKADSGVLERVCAPMDYGPGSGFADGLNRYWFWDAASNTDAHTMGLLPQQIVDLQVLGEEFDPAKFEVGPSLGAFPQADNLPAVPMPSAPTVSSGVRPPPIR